MFKTLLSSASSSSSSLLSRYALFDSPTIYGRRFQVDNEIGNTKDCKLFSTKSEVHRVANSLKVRRHYAFFFNIYYIYDKKTKVFTEYSYKTPICEDTYTASLLELPTRREILDRL